MLVLIKQQFKSLKWLACSLLVNAACAAPHHTAGVAHPSSAAPSSAHTSTLPDWVQKGSFIAQEPTGYVFYGVGVAEGIRNPALLRSAADNRARAEISKLIEVFTASLAKDYMASANAQEKQHAEQAIQTFSSSVLKGVEIVDRYTTGKMYALASLNSERMKPILAELEGVVQTHGGAPITMAEVNDILEEHAPSQKAPTPNPVMPKTPMEQNTSNPSQPSAIMYTEETHLCATGLGDTQTLAEQSALGALARIFSSTIQSTTHDFVGAYTKTGAPTLEVQSIEAEHVVTSNITLEGVRIVNSYTQDKVRYAVACLERSAASTALEERITSLDTQIQTAYTQAQTASQAERVRLLGTALKWMAQREGYNAQLRVVRFSHVGIAAPYMPQDIAAAFDTSIRALTMRCDVQGERTQEVQNIIEQALTAQGFQLNTDINQSVDVLVHATLHFEDAGESVVGTQRAQFVRGTLQVQLENNATHQIFGSFQESRKEGHVSKEQAQSRVLRQLTQKLMTQAGAKMQAAMRGDVGH